MPRKLPWLLGLGFLLMSSGVGAAVDGWVLALTWHPGYCSRHPKMAECQTDQRARLVLHGLWPDTEKGAGEFCAATPALRKLDNARAWCRLPPLNLPAELSAKLDAVMPGRAACLDRHEWLRHGSCSAMRAEDYYSAAAKLVNRVNDSEVGKLLQQRAGSDVLLTELSHAAALDAGPAGSAGFSFICDRRGNTYRLAEVRIGMTSRGPWIFPKSAAFRRRRSMGRSCPEGHGIIIDGDPKAEASD